MKRIVLGIACFGVLCTLAVYSSRLYSDSYYGDRRWSLETETGEEEQRVQMGNAVHEAGQGKESLENSGYVAGGTRTDRPSGTAVEQKPVADQEGHGGEQLQETSLPSDRIQTELPLGEDTDISRYYLVEEFGYVNIYKADMETIYEYTEIHIKDLPQELQDEICLGKWLYSEEELFDFLENYSS